MKASETENLFQTGFQKPKSGLENLVLTSIAIFTVYYGYDMKVFTVELVRRFAN